jgi:hypothetical protein
MKKKNYFDEVLHQFLKPDFLTLFGYSLNIDFLRIDIYTKLGEFEEARVKDLVKKNFNKVEVSYYFLLKKLSKSRILLKKKKRQIDRRHFLYTYFFYTKILNFKTSFSLFSVFANEMLFLNQVRTFFLKEFINL